MFADDWERKAHDVICFIKYGGAGGKVDNRLMQQVADHLRGYPLKRTVTTPTLKLPPLPPLPLPPLPVLLPPLPLPPLPKLPK
jgi:hypothetical protein